MAWAIFGLLFVAGQTLIDGTEIRRFLRAAVVALAGISTYAAFELIGLAPVELATDSTRLGGPFGNPAYLGAACALLLPVAAGAAVAGLGSKTWQRIAAAVVGLGTIVAVGTQTRAAWVGLIAAAVFAAPAWWRWFKRHWQVGTSVALIGIVALSFTPLAQRVVSSFDLESGSTRGRIDEWQVGASVLASNPVVGVGFEGYRIAFAESVDADYERRYTRQVTPDRAHNGALDVGITMGIPGLVAYAAAVAWLISRAYRGVRSRDPWLVGIAAGLVGYMAQQQFLFPLAEVDPVFWLFAGILVSATGGANRPITLRPSRSVAMAALALATVAAVAGTLDVAADHKVREALSVSGLGDHEAGLVAADEAWALRPDSIRYGFLAATIASRSGTISATDAAISRLDETLELSPRDPALLASYTGFLLDRALLSGADADVSRAIAALEALVSGDPFNAQHQLRLGLAYASAGDPGRAEATWLVAEDLAPSSAAPATNLTVLYLESSRFDEAAAALGRALSIDPGSQTLVDLTVLLENAVSDS